MGRLPGFKQAAAATVHLLLCVSPDIFQSMDSYSGVIWDYASEWRTSSITGQLQ